MSNGKLSKERRSVSVWAIVTIVVGLFFLAGAWWSEYQAGKAQDFTSVRVLTKGRPVVGEWVNFPDPSQVALSRMTGILYLIGLCFIVMGLGAMEQAKLMTRLERLEAEIARLSTERSGATGASLPVEPGKQ